MPSAEDNPFIMIPSEPDASFERRVIGFFESIHPLDQVQRAGWVLRGVPKPESVAAHSHFLGLLTLLFVDRYPARFNRDKALTLDIPMPVSDAHLGEIKKAAETDLTARLFFGFPPHYLEYFKELQARKTTEARLIAGLDKAQMMLKIICYEKVRWGRLEEFWKNPANFRDFDIPEVSALFDALCVYAGMERPK
jgi:putative hydrolase of HD superfamily